MDHARGRIGHTLDLRGGGEDRGLDPAALNIALTLPSNEAVLAAVRAGVGHGVLSALVVGPSIEARALHALPFHLPERPFFGIRHKERYRGKAGDALLGVIKAYDQQPDWVI
jgi:DNA-binding transcriptional LysR family regulator